MANIKNVTLSGDEIEVKISGQNCDIRNDGTDTIYASTMPNIVAGADGVISIPAGGTFFMEDVFGKVYIKGSGAATLVGTDSHPVFKSAAAGGGGGSSSSVDQIARDAINVHSSNSNIHHTEDEIQSIADSAVNTHAVDTTIHHTDDEIKDLATTALSAHTSDGAIHHTDAEITAIANGAVNTHASDGTIHHTETEINTIAENAVNVHATDSAIHHTESEIKDFATEALNSHTTDTDIHHTTAEIMSLAGGAKLVMLTKAEFDDLVAAGTDDHDTYYIITDAGGDDSVLAALFAEADPDTFIAEVN